MAARSVPNTHTKKVKIDYACNGLKYAHSSPKHELWSTRAASSHGADVSSCMLLAPCHVLLRGTCLESAFSIRLIRRIVKLALGIKVEPLMTVYC